MPDPADLPHNLRPEAFRGVAQDYVRYRLPYPPAMLEELLERAGPPEGGRLLDLACGPGRLTLALAPRFAEVLGVDLEPEMIAAAEAQAAPAGLRHVRWSVGRVEDLEAPPAHFDLVACGEAFHRLDQPRVSALVRRWLKPGGAFATLGFTTLTEGEAPWRRALAEVVHRWIGRPAQRLCGTPDPTPDEGLADELAVLRAAGFRDIVVRSFDAPHEWTLEALLGNLRSTSVLSRRALGDRHAAFEADLSDTLLAMEPSGRFAETLHAGYTLAFSPQPA